MQMPSLSLFVAVILLIVYILQYYLIGIIIILPVVLCGKGKWSIVIE
jgi:hypothetical protein